jgi:hypothetical protein
MNNMGKVIFQGFSWRPKILKNARKEELLVLTAGGEIMASGEVLPW